MFNLKGPQFIRTLLLEEGMVPRLLLQSASQFGLHFHMISLNLPQMTPTH